MGGVDGLNKRDITWWSNKLMFDDELETFLSHCPNMCGEDDMRDICELRCPLYKLYCVSIEPSPDTLDGSEKE